jgi:hypothetical protein
MCFILFIICLPATPKSSKSLLFTAKFKNTLLSCTHKPRIIFLGGSNLSFGLDGKTVNDSLQLHPINTGIHASLGLKFMLSNYLNYMKKGDVVVLVPEYHQYIDDFAYGADGEELARMVFDVDLRNLFLLNSKQLIYVCTKLPELIKSKLSVGNYIGYDFDFIYSKYVYNRFGDVASKFLTKKQLVSPDISLNINPINHRIIQDIVDFEKVLIKNGCKLFISFPGYQEASFNNSSAKIKTIYSLLKKKQIKLIGTPEMFKMKDSFILNTTYHLNNFGVKRRTNFLINGLKQKLK